MKHDERIAVALEKVVDLLEKRFASSPPRKGDDSDPEFEERVRLAMSGFKSDPTMFEISRELKLPWTHAQKIRTGAVLRGLGWLPYRETKTEGKQKERWRFQPFGKNDLRQPTETESR